jgi:hypothetical protein
VKQSIGVNSDCQGSIRIDSIIKTGIANLVTELIKSEKYPNELD